jgi:hypothetical protein
MFGGGWRNCRGSAEQCDCFAHMLARLPRPLPEEPPMSELSAPPDAAGDPSAVELLRAWLVGDTLQCSLRSDVFEDPASWGAVLADLARYLASAAEQDSGADPGATVALIRDAFVGELTAPTASTEAEGP